MVDHGMTRNSTEEKEKDKRGIAVGVKDRRMKRLGNRYCSSNPPNDDWMFIDQWGYGYRFLNHKLGLAVIQDVGEYGGRPWLHTSVSRRDLNIPSYGDLALVKSLFVGKERMAIQVFVPEEEHVNIHPGVLHLWTPLEHSPLPDFRTMVGGVAMI